MHKALYAKLCISRLVAQITKENATLIAEIQGISLRYGVYPENPVLAFFCKAYVEANRILDNKTARSFVLRFLFASIAVIVLILLYYIRIRYRKDLRFPYRWVSDISPVIISSFIVFMGFISCGQTPEGYYQDRNDEVESSLPPIPDGSSTTSSNPLDNSNPFFTTTEHQEEEVNTDGLPVPGIYYFHPDQAR